MRVLLALSSVLLGLVLLFSVAEAKIGKMNSNFCAQHHPAPKEEAPVPRVIPNVQAVWEKVDGSNVSVTHVNFDRLDQRFAVIIDDISATTKIYADVGNDLLITISEHPNTMEHAKKCFAGPLDKSDQAIKYNVMDSKNGILHFTGIEHQLLQSEMGGMYFVQSKNIRGIDTNQYHFCRYQDWSGKTFATDIYYSDGYNMPGADMPVPVKAFSYVIDSNGVVTTEIINFFGVEETVEPELKNFEVPAEAYCDKRTVVVENQMPKLSNTMSYSFESIDLGDPNLVVPATPSLEFHKEIYYNPYASANIPGDFHLPQFYVDYTEVNGHNANMPTLQMVTYQDFATGLQYNVHSTTGLCALSNITTDNLENSYHIDTDLNGEPILNTAAKTLQLDDSHQYQYMGQHYLADRGISTDVYTTKSDVGTPNKPDVTMIVWYFATKEWMTNYGFKKLFDLPIRMEEVAESDHYNGRIITDLYEFGNQVDQFSPAPDVTDCFGQGSEMYIDMETNLQYDLVIDLGESNFKYDIFDAIFTHTKMGSSIRINKLTLHRYYAGTTLVRFTLVDTSNAVAYGQEFIPTQEPTNQQIFDMLQQAVANNALTLSQKNGNGAHQSGKVVRIAQAFKFKDGQNFDDFFRQAQDLKVQMADTGFSGGAMGGLGVGMLLLGLLLGFGGFHGVKRMSGSNPDIAMQSLGS